MVLGGQWPVWREPSMQCNSIAAAFPVPTCYHKQSLVNTDEVVAHVAPSLALACLCSAMLTGREPLMKASHAWQRRESSTVHASVFQQALRLVSKIWQTRSSSLLSAFPPSLVLATSLLCPFPKPFNRLNCLTCPCRCG